MHFKRKLASFTKLNSIFVHFQAVISFTIIFKVYVILSFANNYQAWFFLKLYLPINWKIGYSSWGFAKWNGRKDTLKWWNSCYSQNCLIPLLSCISYIRLLATQPKKCPEIILSFVKNILSWGVPWALRHKTCHLLSKNEN